ncbi:MAG: hypothetical protein KIH67_001920 [Candidatus Moranbacteria bacterium]|nr:hypothetical protein [Candidatus Moranbacteria bacterium]
MAKRFRYADRTGFTRYPGRMDTEHKLLIPSETKSKNDTLMDVVLYFAGRLVLEPKEIKPCKEILV